MRIVTLLAAMVAPILAAAPTARAQCIDSNSLWTGDLGTGSPSAPASDTGYSKGSSFSYIANGPKLTKWDNTLAGAGQKPLWTKTLGGTIQNFPSPVPLSGGAGEAVFIGAGDGFLYKIRSDGSTAWSRDLRRPSCPLGDQIVATPTVQLWDYIPNTAAGMTWKNAMTAAGFAGQDLVIVPTRYGCGATTTNKIYAIPATSGAASTFWIFNDLGTETVNYISEGCGIDYSSNTLYCGTNGALHVQPSLYAVSSVDGSVTWAQDAGPIRNRPTLVGSQLYVATYDGTLAAYDSAAGDLIWSQTVTASANVVRNPWPEFRNGGYAGTILVVDTSGSLHGFVDLGGYGELAWPTPVFPGAVTTMPAIDPVTGKGWVGLSNGTIQQFDLNTGSPEASATVATAAVYDPSLDIAGVSSTGIDRLTVAAAVPAKGTYQLRRYCIPWGAGWAGISSEPPGPNPPPPPPGQCLKVTDCNANVAGACYVWACSSPDGIQPGVCYRDPKPVEGKPCSVDPFNCGQTKTCHAGVCTVPTNEVANCGCNTDGGRACNVANGEICTQKNGCLKLLSDVNNCRSSGHRCGPGRKCDQGRCIRDISLYCQDNQGAHNVADANVLNQIAGKPSMLGASAVSYDCYSGGAGCTAGCGADLATFTTCAGANCTTTAGITAVTPAGVPTVYDRNLIGTNASLAYTGVDSFGFNNLVSNMIGGAVQRPEFWVVSLPNNPNLAKPVLAGGNALATSDPNNLPFTDTTYDHGPVGPTVNDHAVAKNGLTVGPFYFGNWQANGDVWYVFQDNKGTWNAGTVKDGAGAPINVGSRVRGVAYGIRRNAGDVSLANAHTLYIAFGTQIAYCDVGQPYANGLPGAGWDGCGQPADLSVVNGRSYGLIDLNNPSVDSDGFRPVVKENEAAVRDILSITADPHYGDLFVEVRDTGGNTEMLMVREDDHSVRNVHDIGNSAIQFIDNTANPVYSFNVPKPIYAGEGRLTARSASLLLRTVPGGANMAAAFTNFGVAP
jgi:hypothetical protein